MACSPVPPSPTVDGSHPPLPLFTFLCHPTINSAAERADHVFIVAYFRIACWSHPQLSQCLPRLLYHSHHRAILQSPPLTKLGKRNAVLFSLLSPANEVWGKVIFLHLSVILFTGGTWAGAPLAGTPPWPGTHPRDQVYPPSRYTPRDQVHPPGPGTPPGQVHPPGTRYTSLAGTPLGAVHAGRYGQEAGGTHPTGMHSCFFFACIWKISTSETIILEATLIVFQQEVNNHFGGSSPRCESPRMGWN